AEDLSDADLLTLADVIDIGDLDRARRGTFGHSVPVPGVGFGGRQELTGGIRAVRSRVGLVDPQATLIVPDDPDLGYRPRRRRSRRIGSWSCLFSSPLIGRSCHRALSQVSGGKYPVPRSLNYSIGACRRAAPRAVRGFTPEFYHGSR